MEIGLTNISFAQGDRYILKNVSCTILRNQITCLMGITGSGKTTLVDTIVGRRHQGTYTGTISSNISDARMKHTNIAYCQSVDIHLPEFTVYQHLHYACLLRLGSKLSAAEKEMQCHLAAAAVGIDSVLDSVVGQPGQHDAPGGISDGERKLLSIAMELVGVPPMLCLDDPLAGLDAASTTRVAAVLRSLVRQHGITVLCTLRHPSSLVLSYCDNILLLSRGEVAYSGKINKLDQYLDSVDMVMSTEKRECWSPIECALDRLSQALPAEAYVRAWRDSTEKEWLGSSHDHQQALSLAILPPPTATGNEHTTSATSSASDDHPFLTNTAFKLRHASYENSFLEQLSIFIQRHAHYKLISAVGGVKTILGRFLIAGVLFGFTFKDVGQKVENLGPIFNHQDGHLYAAVYNLLGLMFCYSVFVTVSNFLPIPSLFDMRKLYTLEMANRLYHPFARWLAALLVDIPLITVGTCLFIWVSSTMIKPNGDLINYYGLVSFASVIGFSYANICVEISRTLRTAILMFGMSAALAIWFSGYSISAEDLMYWIQWTPKCSYLYWVTGTLMYEEFSYLPNVQRDFILGKYQYDDMSLAESYTNLSITLVVLQTLLLYLVLRQSDSSSNYNHKNPATDQHLPTSIFSPTHSTPLITKNSFHLTSEEEQIVEDFFGPRESSDSMVEIYDRPLASEHGILEQNRATLVCRRFSYQVTEGRLWRKKEVQLLKEINFVVQPGELCAIMGPIGAGKTTLLRALAGNTTSGKTGGSIRINGYAAGEHTSRSVNYGAGVPTVSYIASTDCHHSLLTVRETLEYAAQLRLRLSDVQAVQAVVNRTLLLLDLDKMADCTVGCDEHPGISKGHMRRLTIGCGLVQEASLLLLDQPTCALDAYLSKSVVDLLRTLADTGRTVLCTIHAPSQENFFKFDKVVLLNQGYVVYFGKVSECESFFRKLESALPAVPVLNTADYIIEASSRLPLERATAIATATATATATAGEGEGEGRKGNDSKTPPSPLSNPSVLDLAEGVARHCEQLFHAAHQQDAPDSSLLAPSAVSAETLRGRWQGHFHYHLAVVLLRRDFVKEVRRARYWVMHFSRCVALGLFLGIVFYDLDFDDEFGRMALFLQVYVVSSLWISELLPDMHTEKAILLQEREAKATNFFVSWLVLGAPVMINLIFSSICFSVPIYYLANLRSGFHYFGMFTLTLYCACLGNLFMAYAVAFFTQSYRSSVTLYPGVVGMQTFYCGYSVIISSLADWFRWGATVNPGTYAMAAWYQNELKNNGFNDYEDFANFFEWDHSLQSCLLYLLLFIVVNKLVLYLALNVMKIKQS